MGLFKKLTQGASNFFKKAGGQVDNIFKKTGDAVVKGADFLGNNITKGANVVGGGLKQAGNFLEKNSQILSDVGAGLAMAVGQPELAPVILGAGAAGQSLGGRIKGAGQSVKQGGQLANVTLNNKTNSITNAIDNARASVAAKTANAVNTMNNLQPANNLAQMHTDLATA